MEVNFNYIIIFYFRISSRSGRDDSFIVYKSSIHLPGPDKSPLYSAFDSKNTTGYHFGKVPKFYDSGYKNLNPGFYDIPGTIGIIAPYARIKSTASIH